MRVSGIPYVQGRNSYVDRDGKKFGIAIHNTSNDASDEAEASYATRRTDNVSSHFYCDRDSVIQSLDTDAVAGHAGSSAGNQNAIAVEITGANGWSRETWLRSVAWDELGRVLAEVCRHYGIAVRRASVTEMVNDAKVRAFYGHDDMRRAWGGTTHTDPGPGFPWDRLFQAVNAAIGGAPTLPANINVRSEPMLIATDGTNYYLCDGITSHPIDAGRIADIRYLAEQGLCVIGKGPGSNAEWTWEGQVRKGWSEDAFGSLSTAAAPVDGEVLEGGPLELSDADVERIAKRVDELLAARLAS